MRARGWTIKEIANQIQYSESTVKRDLTGLRDLFKVATDIQVATCALALGWFTVEVDESISDLDPPSAPAPKDKYPDWWTLITKREQEVLLALADESTTGEVASKLHITFNTTRAHIRSLYRKLNIIPPPNVPKNRAAFSKRVILVGIAKEVARIRGGDGH